jgi:hypothetical protein
MAGAIFGDAFPAAGAGGTRDLTGTGDTTKYAMGTHWRPTVNGNVTGVRWFVPSSAAPTNADFAVGLMLSNVAGPGAGVTWLDWNTGVTRPGSGAQGTWVSLPLSAPVAVTAGQELYVVVRTDRYGFAQHIFDAGNVAGAGGNTVGAAEVAGFPNGAFTTGGTETSNPPNFTAPSSFNSSFYGVDVDFTPAGGPTNATATPSTVAGTTTIGTPTVKTGSTAKPSTVAAVASIPTPTVIVPVNATATPARVAGTASIGTPAVNPTGAWFLWDNLHEIPLTLEGVWNGATIDALTFDEVTP